MTIKTNKKLEVKERSTLASLRADDANSRAALFFGDTEVFRFTGSAITPLFATTESALVTLQTATSGTLLGAGASGANHALGTTADNALEFYLDGTHTTGDMRGMYLRLYFSGAGGSGEAARIFSTVNNVSVATGGTVNGAHVSLSLSGASSAVSGAGNAIRATLGLGTGVTASGTLSGIQVDADFASDSTLTAAPAGIRFTTATSKKWPIAFAFDSVVGTGNAVEAATSAMSTNATAWAIHITVDGADGYIPVYDNKTWA